MKRMGEAERPRKRLLDILADLLADGLVHESKVASEEGLEPEKINGLDKTVAGDDFWN